MSLQERAEQLLFEIRMQAMASKRSIQDKEALEYLLKKGEVYEPMPNFIRPVTTFNDSQTDSLWEVRQPKDKKKTPYEYLSFSQFYSEVSNIYSRLKEMGGFGNIITKSGYKYFLMAGGIGRRKEVNAIEGVVFLWYDVLILSILMFIFIGILWLFNITPLQSVIFGMMIATVLFFLFIFKIREEKNEKT